MATCFLKVKIITGVQTINLVFSMTSGILGATPICRPPTRFENIGNNHMEDWKILLRKLWREISFFFLTEKAYVSFLIIWHYLKY